MKSSSRRAVILEIATKLERFTKHEIGEECYRNGIYSLEWITAQLKRVIEDDAIENIQTFKVPGVSRVRRFASVWGTRKGTPIQEFVLREKMTHDDWVSEHLSAREFLRRVKNVANQTVRYGRKMMALGQIKQKALPAQTDTKPQDQQLGLFELSEIIQSNGNRKRKYL